MKVFLVVIDAASPRVVVPAIQTGQLPSLKRIADAGSVHQGSVTIFPSITPAATASIITGAYPAEHGIAGAAWYDEAQNEIAYYGDDFWVVAKEVFGARDREIAQHAVSRKLAHHRRRGRIVHSEPAERTAAVFDLPVTGALDVSCLRDLSGTARSSSP